MRTRRRTVVAKIIMRIVVVYEEGGIPSERMLCYLNSGRRTFTILSDGDDPRPGTYFLLTKTDLTRFERALAEESEKYKVQFTLDDTLNRKDAEEFGGNMIRRFYKVYELTSPLVK